VTVSGSDDRADWRALARDQPVFDYSRFMDVRNTRVAFEGRGFRYYKLDIGNISETAQSPLTQIARDTRNGHVVSEVEKASFRRADFRIERAQFLERRIAEIKAEPAARVYEALDLRREEKADKKQTIVTFSTCRAPLTALALKTSAANFSRSVIVEGADGDTDARTVWQPLATATASRIDLGTFRQDHTELSLGGSRRFRHYRLTVSNLDSPPLPIDGIELRGEAHELLFFTAPGRRYQVFYGGRDLPHPRYDIGTILASTETESAEAYRLGKQAANAAYQPGRSSRFPESRKLLIGAIIAVVVTLIWLMAKSLKSLDAKPAE
jgi:hypothetical protein